MPLNFPQANDRDEADASRDKLLEEQADLQKQNLEVLEKRIDENEKHIDLLQKNDGDQDMKLALVDKEQASLGKKLEDLESADEFLQDSGQPKQIF